MNATNASGSTENTTKNDTIDLQANPGHQPSQPKPDKEVGTRVSGNSPSARKGVPRTAAPKRTTKPSVKKATSKRTPAVSTPKPTPPKYPRHSVERALRIPRAILEQNAGRPSSIAEAARFLGGTASGEFQLETSSAKKYGFLASDNGKLAITERAKRALRPQNETDRISAIREAVLDAPEISEVYNFYRGEYLPDSEFFANALTERFKIPADKLSDFREVFSDSLKSAQLVDDSGEKPKLIDIGRDDAPQASGHGNPTSRKSPHAVTPTDGSCFVMQPFSHPYGGYYETLFKPAIQKAGLQPVRADDEIFGAGKIMDQVWRGIRDAKVLVAELSTRNANVYYELGLAHALGKPVVLVAVDGEEVPFDVHHIRVIYYNIADPFWGPKLIDKIAENIQSAVANPEEAVLEISNRL
jgi:hypothetical protein